MWNWIADFICLWNFAAWQNISRWPLSKKIVLIKPRTCEEQQPNRRNFHDQDVAVNVLSSKVDGDCCKPPIQSGKAPPCFTSSTEFSGAMLSVCGQILRPVFVIPSYSDFQILVKPHRILAVCVENRYSLTLFTRATFVLTRFPHVVLHLCGPDTCMAWHTAVELYRCSAAEAMQRSCQKKWLCRLAFRLVFLCLWYSAVVYSDSKNYHVLWNVSDIYLQFSRIQIAYFVPRWFSLGGLGFSLDIVSMIFVVDRLGIIWSMLRSYLSSRD